MCKFFVKLCSYFNGLKDGVLLTLVPISAIIGAIGIIVAIIRNKSMRNYINELASECDDRKPVSYSDYKQKEKHKRKMGFSVN